MITIEKIKGNNYKLKESILEDSIILSQEELIETYNLLQEKLKELKILY